MSAGPRRGATGQMLDIPLLVGLLSNVRLKRTFKHFATCARTVPPRPNPGSRRACVCRARFRGVVDARYRAGSQSEPRDGLLLFRFQTRAHGGGAQAAI